VFPCFPAVGIGSCSLPGRLPCVRSLGAPAVWCGIPDSISAASSGGAGRGVNYVPQAAELADASRGHSGLKATPCHVLQQTLKDLDRACREHGAFTLR
jgi:hypothetical protein